MRSRVTTHTEKWVLLLLTVTVALSFGLAYGNNNQNTYLIDGMTKIFPDFLINDWFARQTNHYHSKFSLLLQLIHYTNLPLGPTLVAIELLLRITGLAAIYNIVRLIAAKDASLCYLMVLFLIVVEQTVSVGESYIFAATLQPSSLGGVCTLVALYWFLKERYYLSGLFHALGGWMHTNFLLLGIVFFGLAHLLSGRTALIKRLFQQFISVLPVFFLVLPFLLGMASSQGGEESSRIFFQIRAPHHYMPMSYLKDFILFGGWSLMGLACLGLTGENMEVRRQTDILLVVLFSLVIIATLLTTVIFIPIVAKLYFWRLAPFSVLLSQIVLITTAVSFGSTIVTSVTTEQRKIRFTALRFVMIVCGAFLVLYEHLAHHRLFSSFYLLLLAFFFLLVIVVLFQKKGSTSHLLPVTKKICVVGAALLLLLGSLAFNVDSFYRKSTLINGFPGQDEQELYSWCKQTPVTSTFLIPPDLLNFRLHGERAVVVDWKSTPIDPDGILDWYKRIEDISGLRSPKTEAEAVRGYLAMNYDRLLHLKQKYAVTHMVQYRTKNQAKWSFPVVFENTRFSVVAVEQKQ
jgi:hypothetical protein